MTNKNIYISAQAGHRIRVIRKSLSMSGKQLAQIVGISQQQISRYETGKTTIMVDTLVYISRALNVPVSELLPQHCDNLKTIS